MTENIYLQALQELNAHPIRFGECSITFTFHDGKVQFYTITSVERKNVK